MGKWIGLAVLLGLLVFSPAWASAGGTQGPAAGVQGETVREQLGDLPLEPLESFIQQLDKDVKEYLPSLTLDRFVTELGQGRMPVSAEEILRGLIRFVFKEILANGALLAQIIVLAVAAAILKNLQGAFEENAASKVAYTVAYLVLITLALTSFTLATSLAREAVDGMVGFMQALLPVLLILLTAVGGISSTALFHPVVFGALSLVGTLIKTLVLPLIFFAFILNIVNHISERFQVKKLAGLANDGAKILLGLFLTVYTGVLAVYGVAGSVADGVALRTAKYATGAFVPVVGKVLSDSAELVITSSLLIKNAVGLLGLLALFGLTLFPALKILAMAFIYRLAGALLEPMADGPVVDSLQTMGGSLMMIFGVVAVVGLLFFLAVTIILGTGNANVMIR